MRIFVIGLYLCVSLWANGGTTDGANAGQEVKDISAHRALVTRVKQAETLRVLFVGNSYSFKIPKQFGQLARAEGQKLEVAQVTKGGWTLAKHAASKETLNQIAQGKWDIVVLQEQSQIPSLPENQRVKMMDPAAKALASAVRKAKAIPVFFMTWGRKDGDKKNAQHFPDDTYTAMQNRLCQGYHKAATQADGAYIVPVGEVWSAVRAASKDALLYAKDGSHPGVGGNYLGACVFYCAFYDQAVTSAAEAKVADAEDLAQAACAAQFGGASSNN